MSWYEVSRVDDLVTRIEEPHVDDLLRANTWLVGDVLVDAGLGVVPLRPLLPPVTHVVLTHAHLDHMGAAHEFDRVSAHPLEPVDQGGRGSLQGPALARILGLPDALPALMIEELPYEDYDPSAYRLEPVRTSRPVNDGDLVGRLRVLHLPGHTRGSIALLDEERRTLFSGDVIYDGRLLDELPESNRDDYRRSLQRLLALDIDTVHPGHGDSFSGDRLRELVDNYLASGTTRHAVEPSE